MVITQSESTDQPTPGAQPWAEIVHQIERDDPAGTTKLYRAFNRGIRYFLARSVPPQDIDDYLHETFMIVVTAIKRGELREPDRLMGFVRTVVRRQVCGYIESAVYRRSKESATIDETEFVTSDAPDPEQAAIDREKAELMQQALQALSPREREILVRYYLKEQTAELIMREMKLTETQFRLNKSRAKAKFGEIGKKKLATTGFLAMFARTAPEPALTLP